MIKISVVIPAKNEADNIGSLMTEISEHIRPWRYEIIIVNDGSTDNTETRAVETAQALNCNFLCITHQQSVGQSTALHSGVRHAQGEWIITLDGDGQNDPADFSNLIDLANSVTDEHFCIAGFRKKRKDTAWVRFQSRLANKVRNALLNDGVPDTGCGLKLFPKSTFLALPYFDHMHRYLPALIKRMGGAILIQEVKHRNRQFGTSNYNAWNRMWCGLIDMAGVFWLIRRSKLPIIKTTIENKRITADEKN